MKNWLWTALFSVGGAILLIEYRKAQRCETAADHVVTTLQRESATDTGVLLARALGAGEMLNHNLGVWVKQERGRVLSLCKMKTGSGYARCIMSATDSAAIEACR